MKSFFHPGGGREPAIFGGGAAVRAEPSVHDPRQGPRAPPRRPARRHRRRCLRLDEGQKEVDFQEKES